MIRKLTNAVIAATVVVSLMVSGFSAAADNDAAALVEDIPTIQAFTDEAVPESVISAVVNAGINAPSSMNGQPWHFTVITDSAVLEQISGDMSGGFGGMSGGSTPPAGFTAPADGNIPEGAGKPDITGDAAAPSDAAPSGNMPSAPTGSMPTSSSAAKAGIADAPCVIIISCKSGSELSAGLAAQNMSVEAQLLGYGTKIISSPTIALNGSNQAQYKELLGIPEDMTAVCMLLIGVTDTENYDAVSSATARNDIADVVTYVS